MILHVKFGIDSQHASLSRLPPHSGLQTAAAATTVASSMATATGAMTKMQQQINPAKVNQTMQQFAKENAKMEMTQEMMGDTLDSALDDETTEDETGELVNQVRWGILWAMSCSMRFLVL